MYPAEPQSDADSSNHTAAARVQRRMPPTANAANVANATPWRMPQKKDDQTKPKNLPHDPVSAVSPRKRTQTEPIPHQTNPRFSDTSQHEPAAGSFVPLVLDTGVCTHIAESTRKSDKLDAQVLAEFLALDMIPPAHRPTPRPGRLGYCSGVVATSREPCNSSRSANAHGTPSPRSPSRASTPRRGAARTGRAQ